MLLSSKHGFAFLCMPKCASTSIEIALRNYCTVRITGQPDLKHMDARTYHRYIGDMHKKLLPDVSIEVVCMMREPLEWLHSWYRYRTREELKDPTHPNRNNYTGGLEFDEFLKAYMSRERPPFADVGSQRQFLELENGSLGVDRIFRVDDMEGLKSYFREKLGEEIEIPNENVSPSMPMELGRFREWRIKRYLSKEYELYHSLPGGSGE
ncbi:sulfotransferase family protein [Alloalcanivorax profundimaris]|nr:hypothetical protein [Alloalcanivorax profundimaris]